MIKIKIFVKQKILFIIFFIMLISVILVKAGAQFTDEEIDYINEGNIIKAVSVNGGAPLQYYDINGEIRGISKEVLEEISKNTGLIFSYKLYDTSDEVLISDADIVFGIPINYAPDYMEMSYPFLKSETILYINSKITPDDLYNKKYAAVKGSDLPEGIKAEHAIYYETREASMNAVENGKADYGYGNAYSVSFYTVQNNYQNIIMIPQKKESREYCIGFLKKNEMLLSIINKSILMLDSTHTKTLILNETTQINKKITIPIILNAYGIPIFSFLLFVMLVLIFSIIYIIKVKNEIKIQYERCQILSKTSNEYFYEYNVRTKQLDLSESSRNVFGNDANLSELTIAFDTSALHTGNGTELFELTIANGEKRTFKSVSTPIYDDKGKIYSIVGKLVDVSLEMAEKKELIKKVKTDGLTGLYNAITTRDLIAEIIQNIDQSKTGAFIIIDCDKFKNVNDTYGHLQGNQVLINISNALTQTFRKTDIIGRIGGDEFCVYMRDIVSSDLVMSKCKQVKKLITQLNNDYDVTVSIGVSLLKDERAYDELFNKADIALYEVKKKSGNGIRFFNENS